MLKQHGSVTWEQERPRLPRKNWGKKEACKHKKKNLEVTEKGIQIVNCGD